MKFQRLSSNILAALGAAFVSVALTVACGSSSESDAPVTEAMPSGSDGLGAMEIKESLRTAQTAYRYMLDSDTCYLTYSATVEWPEKFGSYDIKPLQDSIVSTAFGSQAGFDIKAAMKAFSSDTTGMGPDAERISPADVPPTTRSYSSTVSVKAIDTGDKYSTYQITAYSFMGGAHPNTAITSYTYDYSTQQIVTPATLFKAGSDSTVLAAIKDELAQRLQVPADRLTQGGLFNDSIPMAGNMYVVNNTIVFHYGQYEIAPYSAGMFDIDIAPYRLRDCLTPAGQALFKGYID